MIERALAAADFRLTAVQIAPVEAMGRRFCVYACGVGFYDEVVVRGDESQDTGRDPADRKFPDRILCAESGRPYLGTGTRKLRVIDGCRAPIGPGASPVAQNRAMAFSSMAT